MVATLEEKYQLGTVKLSKFTSRQSPAHSKTIPDYKIILKKPTFMFAHFSTRSFGCYFINTCFDMKCNRTATFKFGPQSLKVGPTKIVNKLRTGSCLTFPFERGKDKS